MCISGQSEEITQFSSVYHRDTQVESCAKIVGQHHGDRSFVNALDLNIQEIYNPRNTITFVINRDAANSSTKML
jgi:hypothetical protein